MAESSSSSSVSSSSVSESSKAGEMNFDFWKIVDNFISPGRNILRIKFEEIQFWTEWFQWVTVFQEIGFNIFETFGTLDRIW